MKNRGIINALTLPPIALWLFATAAPAQTPQATPPPPTAPRSGQFPKPVEQTLPNGLRVIVIPRPNVPLGTAPLLIKSGGEGGSANFAGPAPFAATLRDHNPTTPARPPRAA